MPRVLIVAPTTVVPDLSRTVLWRRDVERVFATNPYEGLHANRTCRPKLVVLAGSGYDAALGTVTAIRADPETRPVSLAVVRDEATPAEEAALREAGANAVFWGTAQKEWDGRLEALLDVPRRREARVPVRCTVWNHTAAGQKPTEGVSVNLSTRGMLLESDDDLDVGSRLDLAFRLPAETADLRVVAQVIREAPFEGRSRYGLEFLILRDAARDRIRAFVEFAEGR
jgi:hypothetical protein